jgi:hypothetical protein
METLHFISNGEDPIPENIHEKNIFINSLYIHYY